MKRLTQKNDTGSFKEFEYFPTDYLNELAEEDNGLKSSVALLNKIGPIEDLEEKLGIDVVTLFKAMEQGIRTTHSENKTLYPFLALNWAVGYIFDFRFIQESQYILSDLGKTWWIAPLEELQ